MNKTKLVVFWVSLGGVIVSFLLSSRYIYTYCFSEGHCWKLWEIFNSLAPLLLILLPILFFSLITYPLDEKVFRLWLRFTYWYVPIYVFIILFFSDNSNGSFITGPMFDSEFFSITLSIIFSIISLILIISKNVNLKIKEQKIN